MVKKELEKRWLNISKIGDARSEFQNKSRCLWSTICDNKKASCGALFLMGSVDMVLPSRDSARIANPQIDTAKKWTFLFTLQVFWWKKVKTVVTTAAIFRFSYSKCGKTADLAIAFWKKQIVLCPYIIDNDKEWCKEFVEKRLSGLSTSSFLAGKNNTTDTVQLTHPYDHLLM